MFRNSNMIRIAPEFFLDGQILLLASRVALRLQVDNNCKSVNVSHASSALELYACVCLLYLGRGLSVCILRDVVALYQDTARHYMHMYMPLEPLEPWNVCPMHLF